MHASYHSTPCDEVAFSGKMCAFPAPQMFTTRSRETMLPFEGKEIVSSYSEHKSFGDSVAVHLIMNGS